MNSKPPINSQPISASEALVHCGYIALVGRPNAGKSTLFNAFLGERLSIVTPKPQTTRGRVLGILTRPQSQIIFLDTPGLLQPQYKLHETMEQQISLAARQADLLLLLLDASNPRDRSKLVRTFLQEREIPLVAVLNKTDLLPPEQVEKERRTLCEEFALKDLLPISALEGDNVGALLDYLETRMPLGPKLYPDDMIAEQPERFFVAELIREAAFDHLDDELPYSISILIDEFEERTDKTYIKAVIYVERDSQKGIVIGRKGSRLHAIGRQARVQIEELLAASVYLDLWVKVRPNWRKKERDLKEFGYL